MLLNHGWLAPLSKPPTISENDEEDLADGVDESGIGGETREKGWENSFDREVAEWVKSALERKKSGKMAERAKPALHAAPLDSISPAASPAAV